MTRSGQVWGHTPEQRVDIPGNWKIASGRTYGRFSKMGQRALITTNASRGNNVQISQNIGPYRQGLWRTVMNTDLISGSRDPKSKYQPTKWKYCTTLRKHWLIVEGCEGSLSFDLWPDFLFTWPKIEESTRRNCSDDWKETMNKVSKT